MNNSDSTMTLERYTERDVTQPLNGLRVVRNHWWLCAAGDPKRALFYKVNSYKAQFSAPQCNINKQIVESLNEIEGVLPVFIAVAYVPDRSL